MNHLIKQMLTQLSNRNVLTCNSYANCITKIKIIPNVYINYILSHLNYLFFSFLFCCCCKLVNHSHEQMRYSSKVEKIWLVFISCQLPEDFAANI